jgi:hypothetical protein
MVRTETFLRGAGQVIDSDRIRHIRRYSQNLHTGVAQQGSGRIERCHLHIRQHDGHPHGPEAFRHREANTAGTPRNDRNPACKSVHKREVCHNNPRNDPIR